MKKTFLKAVLFLNILFPFTTDLYANIGKDMAQFFNKFGKTNITEGGAFHDQQGGYYNGGSLYFRSPTRNISPFQATAPGFRMGCGGIDIWAGGFSYINATQLKNALESIASNMGTYAFMLAVETYAPQVHTIIQQLNKLASDFNQFNINSCEVAAAAVGSVWPKSDLGSQAACRMMSSSGGSFSDWASARHGCGNDPTPKLRGMATEDQLVGSFNIAWVVLNKMNFNLGNVTQDKPLNALDESDEGSGVTVKELFMTFSGTIIRTESGEKKIFPPLGDREGFLKALMSGGQVTVYKCDEQGKCINPRKETIMIPEGSSLQTKVFKILDGLSQKIQNDDGGLDQTEAEKSLINATTLPLYKFMNVTTAYQKGRSPIHLSEYAEMIALDVVLTYVDDVLSGIQEASTVIKDIQFTDHDIEFFLSEIRKTKKMLGTIRQSAFLKMDQLLGFIQKTQLIENQLHSALGVVSTMN